MNIDEAVGSGGLDKPVDITLRVMCSNGADIDFAGGLESRHSV